MSAEPDRREAAQALTRQAREARNGGQLDAALQFQLEAIAIYRTLDAPAGLAHALRHAGDILCDAGRPEEATAYIQEMGALYRASADVAPLDVANAIRSQAVHAELLGDKTAAREFWLEARQHYAAIDALFLALTGKAENPGVIEADERLAALHN